MFIVRSDAGDLRLLVGFLVALVQPPCASISYFPALVGSAFPVHIDEFLVHHVVGLFCRCLFEARHRIKGSLSEVLPRVVQEECGEVRTAA